LGEVTEEEPGVAKAEGSAAVMAAEPVEVAEDLAVAQAAAEQPCHPNGRRTSGARQTTTI
jgi:hypothetical protein